MQNSSNKICLGNSNYSKEGGGGGGGGRGGGGRGGAAAASTPPPPHDSSAGKYGDAQFGNESEKTRLQSIPIASVFTA